MFSFEFKIDTICANISHTHAGMTDTNMRLHVIAVYTKICNMFYTTLNS